MIAKLNIRVKLISKLTKKIWKFAKYKIEIYWFMF